VFSPQNRKRVIAIDCDDVIVATAPAILRYYNETYGTSIALENFYSNDLKVWGVDNDSEAIARVEEYLKTQAYQQLSPFEEAVTALQRLRAVYELHVVTARADFLSESTRDMLVQYFPDVFSTVEFTNHYSGRARTKAQVCSDLGADILIEDSLHHALAVAECGVQVMLFGDYPWNRSGALPDNIVRVRDWPEIVKRLL
jgi:5'(3')-deoxyribonucleotidase